MKVRLEALKNKKREQYYEDEEYRNTSGYDQTRHNKDDSTILYIDVYLEDDTYYYGDCNGGQIHILKLLKQ